MKCSIFLRGFTSDCSAGLAKIANLLAQWNVTVHRGESAALIRAVGQQFHMQWLNSWCRFLWHLIFFVSISQILDVYRVAQELIWFQDLCRIKDEWRHWTDLSDEVTRPWESTDDTNSKCFRVTFPGDSNQTLREFLAADCGSSSSSSSSNWPKNYIISKLFAFLHANIRIKNIHYRRTKRWYLHNNVSSKRWSDIRNAPCWAGECVSQFRNAKIKLFESGFWW